MIQSRKNKKRFYLFKSDAENPKIEIFLNEEFQQIQKDVEIANLEFENGDFLDIDSVFLEVTDKFARKLITNQDNLPR